MYQTDGAMFCCIAALLSFGCVLINKMAIFNVLLSEVGFIAENPIRFAEVAETNIRKAFLGVSYGTAIAS